MVKGGKHGGGPACMTVKDIAEHFRSISRKKALMKSKGKEFVKNTAEKRKSDKKARQRNQT